MTDQELKYQIIQKHCDSQNPSELVDSSLMYEIMQCMDEWAGVISKRIDDDDYWDDLEDNDIFID